MRKGEFRKVHSVIVRNNIYDIWDCAGVERFGGIRDGYYIKADAGLVFATPSTFNSIGKWLLEFRRVNPMIPTGIVITKSDQETLTPKQREILNNSGYPWCYISTKNQEGLLEPFRLIR